MTLRSLLALAVMTAVAFALALILVAREGGDSDSAVATGPLFPGIEARLPDVAAIRVTTRAGSFTVRQNAEGRWVIPEKAGYPADVSRARAMASGLAEAETVEPKTSNPEMYVRIGVGDPETGGHATKVALVDEAGAEIAALLVGERRIMGGRTNDAWTYVRKAGETGSWLVKGLPQIPAGVTDWLRPDLITIDRGRVQTVRIHHPDGAEVVLTRESPEAEDFQITDMPEGRSLKYEGVANVVGGALSFVRFEDVASADAIAMEDPVIATFRTFDGLIVELRVQESEGQHWMTLAASVDESALEEFEEGEGAATMPAAPDVAAEARAINERAGGWAYRIQEFKAQDLTKRLEDFLAPSEDERADAS